ncbi:hypothetical protein GLYMA_07G116033v4 [Glycine max]|nr:hypothetical protein GLYMA_07G116033v4 [Glycine max]KAH1086430.1 hypothetical protein GYH30_018104 [Glycine max]
MIPKFPEADKGENFRPIALANFQFKIFADRVSNIAPNIISENQRGFIKGRSIFDCINTTSEVIKLLSFMGSVMLVKFVIHTMLAYSFHVYLWPCDLLGVWTSGLETFSGVVMWILGSMLLSLGVRFVSLLRKGGLVCARWLPLTKQQC